MLSCYYLGLRSKAMQLDIRNVEQVSFVLVLRSQNMYYIVKIH